MINAAPSRMDSELRTIVHRLLDLRVGNQAKDLPAQLCNSYYAYLAIAELRSLKLTAYTDD